MLPSMAGLSVAILVALALTSGVRAGVSAVRLFGILLAAQALLHVIFVLSSDCSTDSMGLMPSTKSIAGHVMASVLAVAILRRGDQVLSSWTALLSAAFGAPTLALPQVPSRPVMPMPVWDAHTHSADAHLSTQVRRGPPTI